MNYNMKKRWSFKYFQK